MTSFQLTLNENRFINILAVESSLLEICSALIERSLQQLPGLDTAIDFSLSQVRWEKCFGAELLVLSILFAQLVNLKKDKKQYIKNELYK